MTSNDRLYPWVCYVSIIAFTYTVQYVMMWSGQAKHRHYLNPNNVRGLFYEEEY